MRLQRFNTEHQMFSTKEEALSSGASVYMGNPCKREHNGMRYALSGSCVQCTSEHSNRPEHINDDKARRLYEKRVLIDHKREEKEHDYWKELSDEI